MKIYILIFLSSLTLSLTYLNTSFVFAIRSVGAINKINAKSSNLGSALLMLNGILIAISLSIIAFMLDTNPNLENFIILFLLTIAFILIGHLFLIFNFGFISKLMYWMLKKYFKKVKLNQLSFKKALSFNFDFKISFAWICHLVAFIFPAIMAVIYNDYRTTLFQLSWVFNSIGTFLTITIIEKKASILADHEEISKTQIDFIFEYLSLVLTNRLISTLFIFLLIIILYFNDIFIS